MFGQLRIVPPKKQKSKALLKQCEMSLFNLFGGYDIFQWKEFTTSSRRTTSVGENVEPMPFTMRRW